MEKRRSGRLCLDTFLKDVVKNAMTEKVPLDQATEKVKTHLSDGLLKTGDKDAAKFRRRKNSFSQEKTDFFFHTREEEDNGSVVQGLLSSSFYHADCSSLKN